jgi:hypothetical protein
MHTIQQALWIVKQMSAGQQRVNEVIGNRTAKQLKADWLLILIADGSWL